eukprot:6189929-Pleurochrysis_carterae.AAC.1
MINVLCAPFTIRDLTRCVHRLSWMISRGPRAPPPRAAEPLAPRPEDERAHARLTKGAGCDWRVKEHEERERDRGRREVGKRK